MSTPAVTPAESAPAIVETEEVSLQERLNAATEEEYKTWTRTGEIPAVKPKSEPEPPKTEPPAVSKEPSAVEPDATKSPAETETAAAPETATRQKKKNADARIQELLADKKQWKKDRERLEALERQIAAPRVETPASQPAAAAPKTETASTRPKPKIDDVDQATGKPKFTTLDQFQDARDEWNREQTLAEIDARSRKADETRSQTEQERKQAEAEQVIGKELGRKFQEARKKYPDFDAVALNTDPEKGEVLRIPKGSVADIFLIRSPHAADVLYHLGQHPEILHEFYEEKLDAKGNFVNKLDPMGQHEKLLDIQRELAGAVQAPEAAAPSTSSSVRKNPLPPPPTVLSARGSAAGDPVEDALKKKSFADYEKAANERERRPRRG